MEVSNGAGKPVRRVFSQPNIDIKSVQEAQQEEEFRAKKRTFTQRIFDELLMTKNHSEGVESPRRSTNDVYKNFIVPYEFEKYMTYGMMATFNGILNFFIVVPLRLTIFILSRMFGFHRQSPRIEQYKLILLDFSRVVIVFSAAAVVSMIPTSYLYHAIRGQSHIKSYAVFNLVEIVNLLLTSQGLDFVDHLICKINQRWSQPRNLAVDIFSTFVYTIIHSILLYIHLIAYNAALNTDNSSLMVLLLLNNFVELKISVFKKQDDVSLFKLVANDVIERTRLIIYHITIFVQGVYTYDDMISRLPLAGFIFMAEFTVDWVKYFFLIKYNEKLTPQIFTRYKFDLLRHVDHYYSTQRAAEMDFSMWLCRRIGFVMLPECVLIATLLLPKVMFSGLGLIMSIALMMSLAAVKFLFHYILLKKSHKAVKRLKEAKLD